MIWSMRRRSVCVGTGRRYFWSAIIEVQANGQRNYLRLIFWQHKLSRVLFSRVLFAQENWLSTKIFAFTVFRLVTNLKCKEGSLLMLTWVDLECTSLTGTASYINFDTNDMKAILLKVNSYRKFSAYRPAYANSQPKAVLAMCGEAGKQWIC